MKYKLFDFQKEAVNSLLKKMDIMQNDYETHGSLSAIALTAPTGAGKTVIAAAVTEGLFYGNEVYSGDPRAVVLWLSDSPSLNDQTLKRFDDATDLLSGATAMETIGPEFAKNHMKLQQGHVYFLNRQLLSANKTLTSSKEGGRTFYDVLTNTIQDNDIHLYLFIDEAHRGLGTGDARATAESTNQTIYAKLIDGQEGINPPMPVVVGISATPERFNNAMNGRKDRDIKAGVQVKVSDVKSSGLIKDSIELRTPKNSVDTKHQDLTQACAKLAQISKLWKQYCKDKDIYPIVSPLMVVQVEDRITKDTLAAICAQIKKTLPWLDATTCFANVFGEHETIITSAAKFPYVTPEMVSEKDEIRILFAKDAISTGWDCPRAEVIYSRRKRSDYTYIAQLIGRMVRTPLARRIRGIDELNTVSCYLPEYDATTVENVVNKLREDHIDETSNVTVNSVDVSFFGKTKKMVEQKLAKKRETKADNMEEKKSESQSVLETEKNDDSTVDTSAVNEQIVVSSEIEHEFAVSVDNEEFVVITEEVEESEEELKEVLERIPKVDDEAVLACFESIITRQVRHDKKNYFLDLWDCVDIIDSDLAPDTGLDSTIQIEFYNNVEAEIVRHIAEYKRALGEIKSTQMAIKRIDPLTGEEFEDRMELATNDAERLVAYYRHTVQKFAGASDLVKYCINKRMKDELDSEEDAIRRMCAVGACIEIIQAMEIWAEEKTDSLLSIYGPFRESVSEENRERWDKIEGNTKPYVETTLNINSTNSRQNKDYDKYPKHIVSDANGWSYHKLDELEQKVVMNELKQPLVVGWYRNQPKNLLASLSIPYELNGQLQPNYPDFIFFQKVGDTVKPAIVDPHGDWLGDSIARLKGYVDYLKAHPDMFTRVLAVTDEKKDDIRYLDLMKKDVQDAIEAFTGDTAKTLFTGPLSKEYKIL